jgi:Flp pilus assembly protein TadG
MKANVVSRLLKCTRAIVTLELALLIPIMWAFLAGAFDLVNLIYTTFEVNNTASTVASMVSQMSSSGASPNYTVASITSVLQYVNASSAPINVAGTRGAVIVTVVDQAATGTYQPKAVWQCENTSMATPPTSKVGKPTTVSVNATLPATRAGFPALVMNMPDSAVIAESYYLYSPWIFGSGFFGVGVYTLYDEAIFRPRLASLAVPKNGTTGSSLITATTGTCK